MSSTALVLGGGGSTGNAWLIGVVAGLFDAGLDVTTADLTVGTSAGSTAAAQFGGATPPELYADILSSVASGRPVGVARPVNDQLARMLDLIASSDDHAEYRRRLGAAALERPDDGSWQSQWRATVASRLPNPQWPDRVVKITAIDAASGEPVVFDRRSGVELVDTVAASCSSRLPYRIGERFYLDGGFRATAENADLADGYQRVLVLSPFGGASLTPPEWGSNLASHVDTLRASGSTVLTLGPSEGAEHLFGTNAMNVGQRPEAARVGYGQGQASVGAVGQLWRASAAPA